jgi:hypothetical protein
MGQEDRKAQLKGSGHDVFRGPSPTPVRRRRRGRHTG